MNLHRLGNLSFAVKAALVISGLVILAMVLLTPSTDLDKLEAMYNRGHYPAARSGLERALARDSDFHDARQLLIKIELAENSPVAALEHLVTLAAEGIDVADLEYQFNRWLMLSPRLDAKVGEQILEVIIDRPRGLSDWEWLSVFGLRVIEISSPESTANYLLKVHPDHIRYNWELADLAFNNIVHKDLEAAWAVATILDNLANPNFQGSIDYRLHLVNEWYNQESIFALQALFPEDIVAAIAKAGLMSSPQGLIWLQNWESKFGRLPASVVHYYSSNKCRLLMEAAEVNEEQLTNIMPEDLLRVIISENQDSSKLKIITQYLTRFPEMAEPVALLSVPRLEPALVIDDAWVFSLSPDGRRAIIRRMVDDYIYEIDTGKEYGVSSWNLRWSPDGSHAVVVDEGSLSTHWVISNKAEQIQEFELDLDLKFIGWRDSRSLWLTKDIPDAPWRELYILTMDGGLKRFSQSPLLPQDTIYLPGPEGKLAWQSRQQVGIWTGKEIVTFSYSAGPQYIAIRDWLPDGRGVVLTADQLYIQSLDGDLVKLDLPWQDLSVYLSWRNQDELYYAHPIGSYGEQSLPSMLCIYNIVTGEVIPTGILDPLQVAGKRVLVRGGNGEGYIYNLP